MSLSRLPRLIDSHPLSFILKFEGEVKQPSLLLGGGGGGGGGGTSVSLLVEIATASFITFNTSHIGLPRGLSSCSNCLCSFNHWQRRSFDSSRRQTVSHRYTAGNKEYL